MGRGSTGTDTGTDIGDESEGQRDLFRGRIRTGSCDSDLGVLVTT